MTTFGAMCACGATFIRPAPTLGDVIAASAAYAGAGWGYGPAPQRFVRCPACLAAGAVVVETKQPPPDIQGRLF